MSAAEPVAIVGIGCRFPGADGPDAFWRLLADGVDAIREVPPDRWNIDELYDADPAAPGKMNTRWGGFVDNVDKFDAAFFGISPREAAFIDPQQRLLMEVAWEALEDAGLPVEGLRGQRVGVFMGTSSYDYGGLQISRFHDVTDGYVNLGNNLSILANRISYFFDFRGPSIVIDTACSASLVAAYYACQSLDRGESRIALAGGVNVILSPAITIGFSKLQAMAPDGRCKAFDARANGFVRAEGAGVVVLKPLASALADGDRIYAVIRGGAVNQDGRTNGLTAPNGLSQEALLREAFSNAGVASSEIQYIEAHGTGTALGDPIELNALGAVLAAGRSRESRCAVGSMKSNLGHLEAAAGVASLIKLALSINRRQLPPSLHFEKPNPYVRFDVLPLRVVTELEPWPDNADRVCAGVSAFGFGGTNVHLVLEEAPARPVAAPWNEHQACVLALSARNEAALASLARRYVERLGDADDGVSLADLCATAANRRSHHDFRLAAVASTSAEMAERLTSYLDGTRSRELETGRRIGSRRRKMAFVFPGHGSQWSGMGRGLIREEPVFASAIEKCAAAISEHVDWSLIAELNAAEECSRIDDVDVIQPAMFAIQVALCELWRSWGVKPDAVIGHSMGEVAAAYVAGALSLGDAARVICDRGRLAKRASGRGAMVMAEIPFERAVGFVRGYEGRVGIAACNSPTSTVLSGDSDAVEEILARLEQSGAFCRRVKIGYASHSPHMDPLKGELLSSIAEVVPRKATVPFCSTVAGAVVAGSELGPEYWVRNLREPVLFGRAVETLLRDGIDVFLEISPHPILLSAIRECMANLNREGIAVGSLRRREDERRSMLATLASLYVIGKPVDWAGIYPPGSRYVQLPTYPWQRERFWFEEEGAKAAPRQVAQNARSPLLGEHIRPAIEPAMHIWQRELSATTCPMLKDHRCQRQILVPGAVFLEMALEAGRETFADASFSVDNVHFEKPLVLADDETVMLQVVMTEHTRHEFDWQIFAGSPDAPAGRRSTFVRHAHGQIRSGGPRESAVQMTTSVTAVQARCTAEIPAEDHYRALSSLALEHGPSFRLVESVWTGDREAIAALKPPPSEPRGLHMHPGLLDSALQLLVTGLSTTRTPFVLVSTGQVVVLAPSPRSGSLWAHATWRHEGIDARGSVRLLSETGELIAQITDVGLRSFELSTVDTDDAAAARVPVERSLIGPENGEASDDPVAVLAIRLREYVAGVLRLAPAKVDLEQSLTTMGIDSLMAIELKSQIERELGIAIPLLQIAKGPSLIELARSLAEPTVAQRPASPGSQRNDSLLSSLLSLKGKES